MTKPTKGDEQFVRLIQVARGDPAIRHRLLSLLSLDAKQRKSLINTLLDEMKLQAVPKEDLEAAANLLSDDVADTTLELLSEEFEEDHLITDSSLQHAARIAKTVVGMISGIAYGFLLLCVLVLPSDAYPDWLENVAYIIGYASIFVLLALGARIAPKMRWRTLLFVVGAACLLFWLGLHL